MQAAKPHLGFSNPDSTGGQVTRRKRHTCGPPIDLRVLRSKEVHAQHHLAGKFFQHITLNPKAFGL